ncbi:MAG: hypothetical protein V7L23_08490 [Nostoc sp.]|uniref:NACHT C-terminal alpha/beta 1 domain-containing protein n=1 Tax=Nostoc sp. TaxID=1180 RepID=UPI002FF391DB
MWKEDEFVTNSHQRQQLNVKLGELAKEAIDKEATRFRLRQDFVNQFLGYIDDENSLLKLALNRGWLNCVGIDTNRKPVYAFFHASFQEYFAAIAIDDWHFFLNHVPKNPSQGMKCKDGTPKTMAELQSYWELLETNKRVVLVFHPSTTNTTGKVTYSDRFLNDISKFEGAICFMSNPIPDHNTLKFFAPSQPIDEILEWLRRS